MWSWRGGSRCTSLSLAHQVQNGLMEDGPKCSSLRISKLCAVIRATIKGCGLCAPDPPLSFGARIVIQCTSYHRQNAPLSLIELSLCSLPFFSLYLYL